MCVSQLFSTIVPLFSVPNTNMSEFDKEIGILSGAVIIMGTCGSGKSSLGRYIANHSGPDSVFIEGDEHHPIQNITKMSQGSEIRGAIKYILRLSCI